MPQVVAPFVEYAMRRLIFFDIDGTLTRTENGFSPFNEAILNTFGIVGDIRTVVPDGNTDPMIVREIFNQANLDITIHPEQWNRFSRNLRQSYDEAVEQGRTTIRPLPGAWELLNALSENAMVAQGVVTGNFESTAQVKLARAGLISFLRCGAYASDSDHRADLPGIAKERWQRRSGEVIELAQCVIVGDTPKDLEAARANGMKCLLVGTGRYAVEDLAYYKPDATVTDLKDIDAVTEILLKI